jgi:uncharacterized protein DUF2637
VSQPRRWPGASAVPALTCACNGQDCQDGTCHYPEEFRLSVPPPPKAGQHHAGEVRPPVAKQTAERYALNAASAVIVALTAGAFWLSYAHLADVAGQHGLHGFPARRWAWPATLDAFIVAGELLMLRAGLRRSTDRWAIAVTATGSIGSIALNVAGVSGTRSAGAPPLLDYVVAAVPPTAALLAFGVLMRQIHQLVDQPATGPDTTSAQPQGEPATASVGRNESPDVAPPALTEHSSPTPRPAVMDAWSEPSPYVPEGMPRGGRPPGATLEELVEIGRTASAEKGELTRAVLREAVAANGLTIGSERQTKVMKILRGELAAAAETGPARG